MSLTDSFYSLTTDRVLDAVEGCMQKRATGRVLALNSLENRVYEIEFEDGSFVVAKFYRPGRWSENQLMEEHQFLQKLKSLEIPVVAPISKLAKTDDGIWFVVFPKVRGRLLDELSKTQLETLGRYLGRIHNVGKSWPLKFRLKMNSDTWGRKSLEAILNSKFIDPQTASHYKTVVENFLNIAEPTLKNVPAIAVHGDCHLGNTLWDGDSPFFLDFDDLMLAPAVQDIWMIIRGRDEESLKQREILLSTYEQMNEFDYSTLSLIEVLRGLRIVHYSAWIAKRWDDPSFPSAFPSFGSPSYWRSELEALQEIAQLSSQTNYY